MKSLENLLKKINQLITLIGGIAVSLMVLHVTLDVFFRFVFSKPLPGTISIVSHYYMVIAIFLPLAFTEQTKASITVDLVSRFYPPWLNRFLDYFIYLFVSVTSFIVAHTAWGVSLKNFASKTSVMQADYTIPIWPSYFVLSFGMFLLSIYCFTKFLLLFVSKNDEETPQNNNELEGA